MLKLKEGHNYLLKLINTKDCGNDRLPKDENFIGNYQASVTHHEGFWCTTLEGKTIGFALECDIRVLEEYDE